MSRPAPAEVAVTTEVQYRVEHRGGLTGRSWRPLRADTTTDRDTAERRAEVRRQLAPEEQVRVVERTVTTTDWRTTS